MRSPMQPCRRQQRGMTLVIGLIMLIMISLAAIASYNMTKTSLDVVGNMQFQNEAATSADSVIQEALSTVRMFQSPTTVLLNPCEGTNNLRCFDVNQDGEIDIRAQLQTPDCVKVRPKPNAELDLTAPVGGGLPEDAACATGVVQGVAGIAGAMTGNSQCAETTWDITAVATDAKTNANVTVTQGVEVRVSTENAETFCL